MLTEVKPNLWEVVHPWLKSRATQLESDLAMKVIPLTEAELPLQGRLAKVLQVS